MGGLKAAPTIALLFLPRILPAEGDLNLSYGTYADNNGVTIGLQRYDVTVPAGPATQVTLRYGVDTITSASRNYMNEAKHGGADIAGLIAKDPTRFKCANCHLTDSPNPRKSIDTWTGATTPALYDERHDMYGLGITRRLEEWTAGLDAAYGTERDYRSRSAKVTVGRDLLARNTTLTGAFGITRDDLTPIGTQIGVGDRTTWQAEGTWTQVWAKNLTGQAVYAFSAERGILSNPYHRINLFHLFNAKSPLVFRQGTQSDLVWRETHPDRRDGHAIAYRTNAALPWRGAVNAEYRFYRDDWGVLSHTAELRYPQYLWRTLLLRPRYRYYWQTASNFFKERYDGTEEFMTSDLRLSPFSTHLVGVKLGYTWPFGLGVDAQWDRYLQISRLKFGYSADDSFFQTEDLKYDVVQVGVRYGF